MSRNLIAALFIGFLAFAGIAYGQSQKANISLASNTKLQQDLTALTARVAALETQLNAAATRITALERADKIDIVQWLGTRDTNGAWDGAKVEFINTDGTVTGVLQGTIPTE